MVEVGEQAALDLLTKGWDGLLAGHGRELLEAALTAWIGKQRWFGAKTRTIARLRIAQWVEIPVTAASAILPVGSLPAASTLGDVLLVVELTYADGSEDRYQVPLAFAAGGTTAPLRTAHPKSIVLEVETPTGEALFHDATVREEMRLALLGLIEHESTLPVEDGASASAHVAATLVAAHESRPVHEVLPQETVEIAAAIEAQHSIEVSEVAPEFAGHMPGAGVGEGLTAPMHPPTASLLRGERSDAFAAMRGTAAMSTRVSSAEQSNTNVIYGTTMIMKVFRRLQPGLNPDVEIGRFLTKVARYPRIAPFLGEITLSNGAGHTTLAMLQGLIANEGDGWEWTLRELSKFYAAAGAEAEPGSERVKALAGEYLGAAATLGQRTAEMHLALATATADQAFSAEPVTSTDLARDADRVEMQIEDALSALQARWTGLAPSTAAQAELVMARRAELLERARTITRATPSGERIRIHGDYHLGQILRTTDDFVLLDFEGEPAKSLEERRRKQSPLRDVAGMLRSFSYVAYAGLQAAGTDAKEALTPWSRAWESAVCAEFLRSYEATALKSETLLPEAAQMRALLKVYLLEKALYELLYELNNRPAWVGIPLAGICSLLA